MLERRLIPALLVADGRLVKTVRFGERTYVGDPINTIRIFNDKEVDELIVLDIDAGPKGPDVGMLEDLAAEAFMPLSYGGGIRSREAAASVLAVGIEKVCIREGFLQRPELVRELAEEFGSQAVVVGLDICRSRDGSYSTLPYPHLPAVPLEIAVERAVAEGAGEVLVQAADRDGTMTGLDQDLIGQASRLCSVPIIALGGLSGTADAAMGFAQGAHAIAGGAFFVFRGRRRAVLITYPARSEMPWVAESAAD